MGDVTTDPWSEPYTKISFGVYFGCPGSQMQDFINKHHKQWNVKNCFEAAVANFCDGFRNHSFNFNYTPPKNLRGIRPMRAVFNTGHNEEGFVQVPHDKSPGADVYAKVSFNLSIEHQEFYSIFGGSGGNIFFFGGSFEAEKVEASEWYDVKSVSIDSLNFMDKLGRKTQLFPAV